MTEDGNMPTFQFVKLLHDDEELYKWLMTIISDTGIAKIENAPKEKGHLPRLAERIGYFMRTSHGLVAVHISKAPFPLYRFRSVH